MRAKTDRNVSYNIIMIRIVLLKHVKEFGSGIVDALLLAIVNHVIHRGYGLQAGHNFA